MEELRQIRELLVVLITLQVTKEQRHGADPAVLSNVITTVKRITEGNPEGPVVEVSAEEHERRAAVLTETDKGVKRIFDDALAQFEKLYRETEHRLLNTQPTAVDPPEPNSP